MPERINLAAYTEPTPTDGYPGYYSLNREADGSITLTVRSPGHGGTRAGTITLPRGVMLALADSLKFDGAQSRASACCTASLQSHHTRCGAVSTSAEIDT